MKTLTAIKKNCYNLSMYSEQGNNSLRKAIIEVVSLILGDKRVSYNQVVSFSKEKMQEIYNKGYKEIYDSEPVDNMAYFIRLAAKEAEYNWNVSYYDF